MYKTIEKYYESEEISDGDLALKTNLYDSIRFKTMEGFHEISAEEMFRNTEHCIYCFRYGDTIMDVEDWHHIYLYGYIK